MISRRKIVLALGMGLAGLAFQTAFVHSDEPKPVQPLSSADFDKLHQMLKRQPGESRWMEIDWYPNVWEGRQKAAKEGKPLFLWAGSGGAPAAGC